MEDRHAIFDPPSSILVGRFGTRLPQKTMGRSRTLPTPEPAKRPTFNAVISARYLHFMLSEQCKHPD
jgi:hypothetical protein